MPETWVSIARNIKSLETKRATEGKWIEASDSSDTVHTVSEMLVLVTTLNLTPAERKEIQEAFEDSVAVRHFGFECNFHALVFFDQAGTGWKVMKW